MNELSRHLIEPGSHAHLRFHPGCPVCRNDRLAGPLPNQSLIPPRASAGLLAAMLATSAVPLSAAVTPPVAAAEGDQEQDGAAAPGEGAPGDPGDVDPGQGSGADTQLGEEQSAPGVGTGEDGEADVDESGPLDDVAPEQDDPPPVDGDPLKATDRLSPEGGAGSRGGQGSNSVGGGPGDTRAGAGDQPEEAGGTRREKRDRHGTAGRQHAGGDEPNPSSDHPPSQVVDTIGEQAVPVGQGPVTVAQSTPTTSSDSSDPDGDSRYHVVQPGESLWSIAADLLGERATSANIAREVQRLWSLNAAAIGTGNPDLLMIGQRVQLP